MSEQKTDPSWWQTLPGVLTGIAAVITAVGGAIAVLHQNGLLGKGTSSAVSSADHREQSPSAKISPSAPEAPKANSQPAELGATRAGHYAFKLLDTKVEPYSTDKDGKLQKLALRLSIRVTDVMGMSDYVDRRTIQLSVDGAQLIPENSINFSVYDRQSVDTEALFIMPANASAIALLLGRPEDTVTRLPLHLNLNTNR
ncbi:hypothetical protein [Pseudoduganella sp. R-34]|uniref:hypothetical protein n=1 Tax=Pseudoduganella sp. R-34 TaxID=3404062 RepID=UPI003CF51A64